ncbi:MAG: hypothetical protein RI894_799 [Bacteroidota bacterium]|jgi:putative oxidoreductase
MKYLPLVGRILFSLIFIMSGLAHIMGQGVEVIGSLPMPGVAIVIGGLLSFAGGLSVALGYKSNIGTLLIIVFLLATMFTVHNFWTMSDPMTQQIQMAMFMKNLALIGAAILIHINGTGDMSLDNRTA